jgi:hypothetical protein
MHNGSGANIFRRARHNWEVFDALPYELKRFIWEAPIPMTTSGPVAPARAARVAERWRADMKARLPGATERAYGPDHPGSRTTIARLARLRADRDVKLARLAQLRAELGVS